MQLNSWPDAPRRKFPCHLAQALFFALSAANGSSYSASSRAAQGSDACFSHSPDRNLWPHGARKKERRREGN